MKRTIFLVYLTLALLSVAAQEPWSIEQCVRYAIENNIQVKQSATDIEVSRLGHQQAKMAYIPSLNAQAGYNANWGRSLDPTTYQFINNQTVNNMNTGLSLNTTVFAGMQKMHELKKSQLNLLSSVQSNEQLKNEIAIAVASAYLQVLYNTEQIRNNESQIASLEEQVARTQKLVDAGAQPLGALLELQSQLAAEQYNRVNNKNLRVNSMLNLKQLLEIRDMPEFEIQEPIIDSISAETLSNFEQTYQAALVLPQIEVARLQKEISTQDVSLSKAKMYPSLTLGASYGTSWSDARQKPLLGTDGLPYYTKYPFFDQLGDNASSAVQLTLSIPIFNSLNAQRGIKIAKWYQTKAELGLTLAKDQLYKEIQQAYTDATSALERYGSAIISLKSSSEAFVYAQQKFSAGAVTSVDYTTAKNNHIIAQSMVTQAKYEFIFKTKILDFYAGIPIKL